MSTVLTAIRARLVTIVVWAVIILIIAGIVSYNRSNQIKLETALSSSDQAVRDQTVMELVDSDRLIDVLTNTQNPNEDAKSPQNLRSVTIRENAADSVHRMAVAHKIAPDPAFNTLFQLRKDGDQKVKDTATQGLAVLGSQSDSNLAQIVRRLSDGDPDLRGAAVDALADKNAGVPIIDPDKAARAADAKIKDPSAQDAAESALTNIGPPSVPYLIAHLSDPDAAFQQQIVDVCLDKIGAPSAVPALVALTKTGAPSVRRSALVALADTILKTTDAARNAQTAMTAYKIAVAKDPKTALPAPGPPAKDIALLQSAKPPLLTCLANPEDPSEARAQSALALGRLGGPDVVRALIASLGDYDAQVAQSALVGVQSAGAPAVAPLTVVLAHGDDQTRAAAAEALGGIGDVAALGVLKSAFADPATPFVIRQSAAVGLGRSGNIEAIPSLIAALGDADGRVASAASQALLSPRLRDAAIPQLIAAFTRQTPVPFNASQTLAGMGGLAIPALKTATAAGSGAVQTWAAVTLGQTDSKDPAIVVALTPLSQSADPHVQWAATQALNRLTGS